MNWKEMRANTVRGVLGFGYGLIRWRLTMAVGVSAGQLDFSLSPHFAEVRVHEH